MGFEFLLIHSVEISLLRTKTERSAFFSEVGFPLKIFICYVLACDLFF